MFDTTIVRTENRPYAKTVTEKRAPTDDSVRLLGEMEHAAEQKILDRVLLKANECGIDAFAVVFSPDTYHKMVKAKFFLNGAKFYIEEEIDTMQDQKYEIIHKVAEGIANKLTMELMKKAVYDLARCSNG